MLCKPKKLVVPPDASRLPHIMHIGTPVMSVHFGSPVPYLHLDSNGLFSYPCPCEMYVGLLSDVSCKKNVYIPFPVSYGLSPNIWHG